MSKRSDIDDLRFDSSKIESFVVDAYPLRMVFLPDRRMMRIHDYEIGVLRRWPAMGLIHLGLEMLLDGDVGNFIQVWFLNGPIGHYRSIAYLWWRAGWRIIASSNIVRWAIFFSSVEVCVFPKRRYNSDLDSFVASGRL